MKFYLCLTALLIGIYFLFLHKLVLKDPNWESMDVPVTVGLLQKYHGNLSECLWDETMLNYEKEDYPACCAYPKHRFRIVWIAETQPFLILCYWPFIKIFGVCSLAVSAYGTFYGLLAMALTGLLAFEMYGKWHALLSVAFLCSSLSWIIHVKTAVQQPMPCVCLMIGMIYCIRYWSIDFEWHWLVAMGTLIALAFYSAWVAWPLMIIICVLIMWFRWKTNALIPLFIIGGAFMITVMLVCVFWDTYLHYSPDNVLSCVYDLYLGRFAEGSVPAAAHYPWYFKPWYELKLMFWSMDSLDHADKMLEAAMGIPIVFSAFFFYGFYKLIRNNEI